jgi:hypothetical protein
MCIYYYHYGYYYCYCLEKTLSYTHFAQMESTFTIILSKTILNLTIFYRKSINIMTQN